LESGREIGGGRGKGIAGVEEEACRGGKKTMRERGHGCRLPFLLPPFID